MRSSMAASRQSQLPGSVSSAAAMAKLLEKKKEFEAVAALERASAQFVKRIEELGDDFDVMADAGVGACIELRCAAAMMLRNSLRRSAWAGPRAVAQHVQDT